MVPGGDEPAKRAIARRRPSLTLQKPGDLRHDAAAVPGGAHSSVTCDLAHPTGRFGRRLR